MALLYLLIDTGCRVNEALTLTRAQIDSDNLLVMLKAKGQKERMVPISLECRKALYRTSLPYEEFPQCRQVAWRLVD